MPLSASTSFGGRGTRQGKTRDKGFGSLGNVSGSVGVAEVEQGERKMKGRHDKGPADILVTRSAG
jgi:hypothetical protein